MALDLHVKLTKDIKVNSLLSNCRKELRKLTDFEKIPYIQAYWLENGVRIMPEEDCLLTSHDVIVVKFQDIKDEVSIIITELKLLPPYIMEEEAGIWAGISVQGGGGSNIKLLLAAGLALCLANMCDSHIEDDRNLWCKERESSYEVFFNGLKCTTESLSNNCKNLEFKDICDSFAEQKIH